MLKNIPIAPRVLGLAGLLPPLFLTLAALFGPPEWQWSALAVAYAYAALIFSFLGGIWWGLAAMHEDAPDWVYVAAILPSLIALVTYIPWILGLSWPGPSMLLLGLCIIASPLVDQRLVAAGIETAWLLTLRWILSVGLGILTLTMAAIALISTP
ncbi:DUF3429 domain-containing protein [Parasphingorhabdus cellanae]|uniref:DUF3429 domain-containing protein n=1 Tax=Parasphingorhabdus cellanae TaxID=2806553 RepID=A0ABX7T6H6_9SPHN|nr:DUF3429 domain-containing protein [Parasphingorhabdus cellanae]QTD56726.1 DUF3429 domain-containing protein [Parasphingorhabdus cellanae]